MATATATLSNFRQSPRKMRMVANLVRGKKVSDVLVNLDFTAKRSANPIQTLIKSALANAKAKEIPTENLIVKTIKVDSGKILYRSMPAARGSAHRLRKRTCAVFVELGEPVASRKHLAFRKKQEQEIKKGAKKPIVNKSKKVLNATT